MAKEKSSDKLPSAFSLFQPSMEAVKRNLPAFLWLYIAPTAYFMLVSLFGPKDPLDASGNPVGWSTAAIVLFLIGIVVSIIIWPATIYLELHSAQGKKLDVLTAIKSSLRYFWRLLGLSIVVGLITVVGFLLLIVPGVFMIRRYFLSAYYLVDKNLSIGEAMKMSAEQSKPFSKAIWAVIGVMVLLSLTGIVPIVGWIFSAVLTVLYSCAPAFRYLEVKAGL